MINPIEFLRDNPNVSFDTFKLAFKGDDSTKLRAVYDAFKRQPTFNNSVNKKKETNELFSDKTLSNMKNYAITAVGVLGTVTAIKKIYNSMSFGADYGGLDEELGVVNSMLDSVTDLKTAFSSPMKYVSNLAESIVGNNLEIYFKQQTGLLNKMNQEVGLTGYLSKDVREEITMANPELLKMGVGFSDLVDFSSALVTNSGKFVTHNRESLVHVGGLAQAYMGGIKNLAEYANQFEEIGYGMVDTANRLGKSGKDSLALGLRTQTVIEKISENVNKVNQYGFKNGIEGLTKMVQKSIEFRTNMNDSYSIADKVWDLTDAVGFSAELQSLGGAVGAFMDPFKLSYMAVNDVNGIQDALIEMSKGLATYNSEQGKFTVTGGNLRLAREYAKTLGVDMQSLTKTSIAAAERQQAHNDLLSRGLTMSKDQEEFMTNIAQMKDGRMVIELVSDEMKNKFGATEVSLDKMTQQQLRYLDQYRVELEKANTKDIVRDQATIMQGLGRDVAFIAASMRIRGGKMIERAASAVMYDQGFKKDWGDDLIKKVKPSMDKMFTDGNKTMVDIGKKFLPDGTEKYLDESFGKKKESEQRENHFKELRNEIKEGVKTGVTEGIIKSKQIEPKKATSENTYIYSNGNGRSLNEIDKKKR